MAFAPRGKEDGEERQNIGKRWELSNYCVRMDRRRKRSASEYSEVVLVSLQFEWNYGAIVFRSS